MDDVSGRLLKISKIPIASMRVHAVFQVLPGVTVTRSSWRGVALWLEASTLLGFAAWPGYFTQVACLVPAALPGAGRAGCLPLPVVVPGRQVGVDGGPGRRAGSRLGEPALSGPFRV